MSFFPKRIYQGFTIELVELPAREQLQHDWRELEQRSQGSFFTSWTWIGAWLESLPHDIQPVLLRASRQGRVMGMGILVSAMQRKAKLIPIKTWYLHETGRPALDNITIEYNGLLVDDLVRDELEPLMLQYLLGETTQWDELQLNALSRPVPESTNNHIRLSNGHGARFKQDTKVAYQVPLASVRAAGQYVDLIKPKPRYHIKRSLQAFETAGPVTLTEARTKEEARAFMERLKALHRAYWEHKGQGGAFGDAFFNQFHDRLIDAGFDRGEIQILAIKAGEHEIGYLYNFVWQGHVYNYQSGIDYEAMGGKHSPGMVCHALAITHNTKQGHHTYDLMAGDHQYKRALTLETVPLAWHTARRVNFCTSLEDGLKAVAKRSANVAQVGTMGPHVPDWFFATPISMLA